MLNIIVGKLKDTSPVMNKFYPKCGGQFWAMPTNNLYL